MVSGGTLRSNGTTFTLNEPITLDGGAFAVGGAGDAALTLAGPVTVGANGGTFQIDGGTGEDGLTVTSTISGAAGGQLNMSIDGGSTLTVTSGITNNGNLVKTGDGVLAIADGASVSSPEIVVNNGTLDVSLMSAGAGMTIADGQLLGGTATVLGNVATESGSTLRVGDAGLPMVDVYAYVDATDDVDGNTTYVDGSVFTSGDSENTAWITREFANGGTLFQAGVNDSDPNVETQAETLKTVITGLTPGESYTVYANYWTASGSSMRILAGDAEDNLTLYDADYTDVTDATNGTDLSGLVYAEAPLITEGNRTMWGAPIGTLVADESGEIAVFVDDTATDDGDDRTWYDGVTYSTGAQQGLSQGFTIDGDLTVTTGSSVEMDIFDSSAFDTLTVTGAAELGGTLTLISEDVSNYSIGDEFLLLTSADLTGVFDAVSGVSIGMVDGLAAGLAVIYDAEANSVSARVSMLGDANGDDSVDLLDLSILATNFDDDGTFTYGQGDFNGDGRVDLLDLSALASSFGNSVSAVPEPTACVLLGLGAVAGLRRRVA